MNQGIANCKRADFLPLAAEILAEGRALRFKARGGSMYPFVRDGDVVHVKPVEGSAVGVGDVVLCRYGENRLVAHRVIGVSRERGQVAWTENKRCR